MTYRAWMLVAGLAVAGLPRAESGDRKAPDKKPETKAVRPAAKPSKAPRDVPAPKASKSADGRPALLQRKGLGLGCSSGED